jgi:thioredoxin 1
MTTSPPPPVNYMNNLKVIKQQSSNNPNQLFIIDFYAKWCGPCKQLMPKLEELAIANPSIKFYKTDVDDELATEIFAAFPFTSLPTIVYIKNFKEVAKTTGANIETVRVKIAELN